MRFKSESRGARIDRLEKWHRWLAWRPVRVGEEIFWLEQVERRLVHGVVMDFFVYSRPGDYIIEQESPGPPPKPAR